jgi:Flp pilus assembly protein TadG
MPQPRRRPTRRSARSQRGAVAVEAALVTPLLFLLVFGIIEFGMLFKDSLGASSAVRAGARMASAEPRAPTFATDAAAQVAKGASALDMHNVEKLWVYKADVNGFPVGGVGTFNSCTSCVKFSWNAITRKFDVSSNTWLWSSQNACQGDPLHDSVGVYLQVTHPAVTGLIFDHVTLHEHTVMSLEPMPMTSVCK